MITIGRKDGNIEKLSLTKITQKTKGFPTHTVIGGEFAVAPDSDDIALKTLLGSCVALMFYDRKKKIKAIWCIALMTVGWFWFPKKWKIGAVYFPSFRICFVYFSS